jgi:hypothetical protein
VGIFVGPQFIPTRNHLLLAHSWTPPAFNEGTCSQSLKSKLANIFNLHQQQRSCHRCGTLRRSFTLSAVVLRLRVLHVHATYSILDTLSCKHAYLICVQASSRTCWLVSGKMFVLLAVVCSQRSFHRLGISADCGPWSTRVSLTTIRTPTSFSRSPHKPQKE